LNAVPRLSIGLPVYNGERYLAKSLNALLSQTYEDFELIISDNASTDSTADICRRYEKADPRIRYVRQPRNIGAAPNHNFLFREARGELFKWAGADDLYARNLLESCIAELDEHPEAVLVHSWTAAIDSADNVTQTLKYPLTTDSTSAPERFRTMLFGSGEEDHGLIHSDDQYGVIRADVLRRVAPENSFYHADRVFMIEIALQGPFRQVPDWLYFRRDHADRPQHASPTVRGWCTNLDPRRADKLRNPTARLVAEFLWGYVAAIRRAPISAADRRQCYLHLYRKFSGRVRPVLTQSLRGGVFAYENVPIPTPKEINLSEIVGGLEQERST
jgi:glycosyltransferase involved in cell wall biosynthesis